MTTTTTKSTAHPLVLGPTGRYLVDQRGDPFLMVGDAAWSIFVNLNRDEAVRYLDDRQRRGFNTLLINLLEYCFSADPPRNRFGDEPFTTPGDFRTPNPAYFDHARWVLERAAERGFLALLTPCYLGYAHAGWPNGPFLNEGWFGEVAKNGYSGCRSYGRFVGERFGDLDGIMWVIGGDRDPGDLLLEVSQMSVGIRETDPRHLMTAHCNPDSVPADIYRGETWLDVNNTYSYGIVHARLMATYARTPTLPFFLMESTYENMHTASDLQLRRQAYWSVLRGGFGHVFGCTPIWPFSEGWEAALDGPGSRGMFHFATAFRDLRWWDLVPEPPPGISYLPQWHGPRVLLAGFGESQGLDFCTIARTPDGGLAVAYMPTARELTLNLALLAGARIHLSWFDPRSGEWTEGGIVDAGPAVAVSPPAEHDWLLVMTPVQS